MSKTKEVRRKHDTEAATDRPKEGESSREYREIVQEREREREREGGREGVGEPRESEPVSRDQSIQRERVSRDRGIESREYPQRVPGEYPERGESVSRVRESIESIERVLRERVSREYRERESNERESERVTSGF